MILLNTKNLGRVAIDPRDVARIATPMLGEHPGCAMLIMKNPQWGSYVVEGTVADWAKKLGIDLI